LRLLGRFCNNWATLQSSVTRFYEFKSHPIFAKMAPKGSNMLITNNIS